MKAPTVGDLLATAQKELSSTSNSARLDAEVLLSHVSGLSRMTMLSDPATPASKEVALRFQEAVSRRKQYEPVAYITGVREFWGLELLVDKRVLVPRPETELIVERGLQLVKDLKRNVNILDLGTGSGCIAVALGHELKSRGIPGNIIALDINTDALLVARNNVARYGLQKVVRLLQSDWFSVLQEGLDRFDLIVSNPPYLAPDAPIVCEDIRHEPRLALFAKEHGFSMIRQLISEVPKYSRPGAVFLCEIDPAQAKEVQTLIKERLDLELVSIHRDLNGHERLVEILTSTATS